MTWRSDPGPALAANYVVTSAIAQPSLGRPLSSGNVTVNLVEPGTLYGARINNFDMRIAKILRFAPTRAQVGVDIYNLLNTDVVTTYNNGYTAPAAGREASGSRRRRYCRRATRGSICSWISRERSLTVSGLRSTVDGPAVSRCRAQDWSHRRTVDRRL